MVEKEEEEEEDGKKKRGKMEEEVEGENKRGKMEGEVEEEMSSDDEEVEEEERRHAGKEKNTGRRKTVYYCKTCPAEPGLCPVPCFELYHTKLLYKMAAEMDTLGEFMQ